MPGLATENPPILLQPVAPKVMPEPESVLDEMSGNFVFGSRKPYHLLAAQARQPRLSDYIVQSGDSLWTIANANDTDINTLVELNPRINPDVIQPGQVLKIARRFRGIAHTVRNGDTLATIADSFAVSVAQLQDANGLSTDAALSANDVVLVPATRPAAARNTLASRDGSIRRTAPAAASASVTATATAAARPAAAQSRQTGMIWPLTGGLITTEFGERSQGKAHTGIDIARPTGTPVVAAKGGTVVLVEWLKSSYGFQIIIDHGDGLQTRYAHASSILVRKGQTVAQGEPVILVGSTGNSTGSHLHFEVLSDGKPINPRSVLP